MATPRWWRLKYQFDNGTGAPRYATFRATTAAGAMRKLAGGLDRQSNREIASVEVTRTSPPR